MDAQIISTLTMLSGPLSRGNQPILLSERQCLAWHAVPPKHGSWRIENHRTMQFDEVETSKLAISGIFAA